MTTDGHLNPLVGMSAEEPRDVGHIDIERLAGAIRAACVRAALDGYEEGGLSGMCAEGRFEMAIESMRSMDLDAIVHDRED